MVLKSGTYVGWVATLEAASGAPVQVGKSLFVPKFGGHSEAKHYLSTASGLDAEFTSVEAFHQSLEEALKK